MILTAVGIAIAGMLIRVTGILAFTVAMAGLGLGLILAQVWSDQDVENPPRAALLAIAATDFTGEVCEFF